ncbi:MAG TPA: asparaginase [Candidatus Peribacteraceae bacterium]|nr:asparaginase [Candidatus Peribacteraceae bacterium]
MARPNIAVLYVGGSIGMIRNQKTGRMENLESLAEIHRFLPELQREVALQFFTLSNLGSSDVTTMHWIEIARTIEKHYDAYDGFVVIHGTNTMSHTAAALSFALQNLSKPVVLTGSLMPINDLSSDGRMNLIFAIRAAQLDIAEVCIVLGPRILRGNRAVKMEQSILHTFDSPHFPALGEFTTSVALHPWRTVRRKRTHSCRPDFDERVLSLTLHPGIPDAQFTALLNANPHGIIIQSYGQGMLPESLFPWLQTVTGRNIPIVVTSQMLKGTIDLRLYRKQIALERLGIISGKDMTYECALTKLMWVLARTKNPAKIRELMERNLAGELTDSAD